MDFRILRLFLFVVEDPKSQIFKDRDNRSNPQAAVQIKEILQTTAAWLLQSYP